MQPLSHTLALAVLQMRCSCGHFLFLGWADALDFLRVRALASFSEGSYPIRCSFCQLGSSPDSTDVDVTSVSALTELDDESLPSPTQMWGQDLYSPTLDDRNTLPMSSEVCGVPPTEPWPSTADLCSPTLHDRDSLPMSSEGCGVPPTEPWPRQPAVDEGVHRRGSLHPDGLLVGGAGDVVDVESLVLCEHAVQGLPHPGSETAELVCASFSKGHRGTFPNPMSVTCYLGSVLQALLHLTPFRQELEKHRFGPVCASPCVLCLIRHMQAATEQSSDQCSVGFWQEVFESSGMNFLGSRMRWRPFR